MSNLLQLEEARLKLREQNVSPREQGRIALLETLEWIYAWGFTTSGVINFHFNKTSGGYLKRLTEKGFLIETKTSSGTPIFYYTLSKNGLNEVEKHSETLHQYKEIIPFRVNQDQMRHDVIAQSLTSNALKKKIHR